MSDEVKTPLLDELEKGPWPSFVTDLKRLAKRKPAINDVLGQLEQSYEEKLGHWKHGGIVGVKGYGGGVIGRYSDLPEKYPNVAEFHTMRINQPSGWFYNTAALRDIMQTWDKFGSGITNFHGATGDVVLIGMPTQNLQPAFDEFSDKGWDLGGSGSCLRSPSCCVGPARCEHACIDTLDICYNLTQEFQDELHRPMWPYKSKIKVSGCSNDCVSAVARADISIIGTWRDALKIDNDKVRAYANQGFDINGMVVGKCPTKALSWDGKTLTLKNEECVRCMQCINMMPKALSIGQEKGATILIGGKSTILKSAFLSWVLVPFMKMEPPYDEIKDLLRKIWEWWDENGKVRERVGELIYRKGMREFLRAVDLEPVPQMVSAPRANPYFFWWPEELNK